MSRQIFVCCDDAGWDEANDNLVLDLAEQKRISAISLLVFAQNSEKWRYYNLNRQNSSLGLHFNLTLNSGAYSSGLNEILLKSHCGLLNKTEIEQSVVTQLTRFEDLIGIAPEFIDGHQHVHMLPVIRNILLNELSKRYAVLPVIRIPYSKVWRGTKSMLLNVLGAKQLGKQLACKGWKSNQDFAGVYDFSCQLEYGARMQNWLATIADKGLIMTHPGELNNLEHASAREMEKQYFLSEQWLTDLAQANIQLIPFRETSI